MLGAPPSVLGLIEGVAERTAAVGKAISGRMADRFRSGPMIALGYGLSSAAKRVIGRATVAPCPRLALRGPAPYATTSQPLLVRGRNQGRRQRWRACNVFPTMRTGSRVAMAGLAGALAVAFLVYAVGMAAQSREPWGDSPRALYAMVADFGSAVHAWP